MKKKTNDKTADIPQSATGVVRGSFTMPAGETKNYEKLKNRCRKKYGCLSKSELVRAGFIALNGLQDDQLITVLGKLEKVKRGRPSA